VRRTVLALGVGVPAVIAALAIVAVEGWRLQRPQSPLFATPFVYSLAEAIERNDIARAYGFIRAGQDANAPIPVRHPQLTNGREVLVSPLMWAVALDRPDALLMLLGAGARLDGPTADAGECLAQALGHDEVLRLLRLYRQSQAAGPCPAPGSQSMILG
jgi:hypothetical protein